MCAESTSIGDGAAFARSSSLPANACCSVDVSSTAALVITLYRSGFISSTSVVVGSRSASTMSCNCSDSAAESAGTGWAANQGSWVTEEAAPTAPAAGVSPLTICRRPAANATRPSRTLSSMVTAPASTPPWSVDKPVTTASNDESSSVVAACSSNSPAPGSVRKSTAAVVPESEAESLASSPEHAVISAEVTRTAITVRAGERRMAET